VQHVDNGYNVKTQEIQTNEGRVCETDRVCYCSGFTMGGDLFIQRVKAYVNVCVCVSPD